MALDDLRDPNLGFIEDDMFWQHAQSLEPKRQHQFMLVVEGIPSFLMKTSARPTLENGEITMDHINVQRYVKGKSKWSAISITLYDPIEPSGTNAVMQWIRLHHESNTGRNGYATTYKKDITIKQLSPLGEVLEEWLLHGAFITSANFGSLDWSSEEMTTIELNIRYDWASFTPGG